ncbi:hypothetical protein HMPREF9714_02604 [Myroides odoratimimus CCUG 12901]|uniref:hypothetical protein n=1 Tax=Myroides odoratimimus TaxID=76832 RepID=UPI0002460971|nr:hypothetical protein [Myroides odoratimimus]EHO07524.1 hypothetical protein HMPREF9714_02604 [Myroides odoratimimus CCUG 12901]MDM1400428.1 hypothetical protein [Myroides odoratimimus]MDM1410477.1 hypothetical protein [Myroides odoratimimus]MDM1535962.1 hypothetical protein [Myroides odoratimimus]MDM1675535.1 hypothetical protein [Myroides odoratimimus]
MTVKQVNIQIKQLNRLSAEVEGLTIAIVVSTAEVTVREFLGAVVTQQVEQHIQKFKQRNTIEQLTITQEALDNILFTSKLRFTSPEKYRDINIAEEVQRVIQAYEDQLFLLFYGERELLSLEEVIVLNDADAFVFIPLNFLKASF